MSIDIKSKEILSHLQSTDQEFVLETIEKIRESGNLLIMEGLLDLLHDTSFPEIKKSILNLFSELKNEKSVTLLISAITNEKYREEQKELVACCWQNGLNYTEYLSVFIELVIHESFLTAFEAFTVIENMYGNIPDEVINQEIIKIEKSLLNTNEEKAYLLKGLLTIIREIPEEQEFLD